MRGIKQTTVLTISLSAADPEHSRLKTLRWASMKELTAAEIRAAAVALEAVLTKAGWPPSIPVQTKDQPLPGSLTVAANKIAEQPDTH